MGFWVSFNCVYNIEPKKDILAVNSANGSKFISLIGRWSQFSSLDHIIDVYY